MTPDAKRKAVAYLCDTHEVSQRRACATLSVDRSTVRYQSKRVDDVKQRDAIKRIAKERRRFGYRRILVMLEREKIFMNHKKLRRIYREEGLQVRKRGGRKRALGTRKPMVVPEAANQRWSLDFVSDALTDGRRFRIFAVVDDHTRECLSLVADTSLSGLRVTRELDRIIENRGRPQTIVSDRRHGVHQHCCTGMGSENGCRMALYRTWKTTAKCVHRKLQWQAAGRMSKRNFVQHIGKSKENTRNMEGRLQLRKTAFSTWKHTPKRICKEISGGQMGRLISSRQYQGLY